jgi:hypothetical protein
MTGWPPRRVCIVLLRQLWIRHLSVSWRMRLVINVILATLSEKIFELLSRSCFPLHLANLMVHVKTLSNHPELLRR